ncbi:MAG: T9SS type A sorting domain-containing protein [Arcicella sp.]|nr:T9SS type A sorting domain-containing protein [Arcicella sp.]
MAQFQTVPLRNTEISKNSSAKTTALSLPFFDDFSTSNITANTQNWLKGGGSFINNNASLSHPTLNMATFDGLKANGVPYNFNDSFANGATDSLTSQTIDLSKSAIRDSVYLSFFYQSQGLGEVADANDSLIVQFLTNGDKWETVFVAKDGRHIIGRDTIKIVNNTKFIQILLPINATKYFHDKFQFRFRTFGRQSGQFDVWHIDYVYLDKIRANPQFQRYNALAKRLDFYDYAFKSNVSPILKNYNAMPFTQFLVKPEKEMSDSIKANVYALWTENIVTSAFTVTNLPTGKIILSPKVRRDTLSTNVFNNQTTSFVLKNPLADLLKNETGDKLILKAKFSMNSGDFFKMNDTVSRIVELDNYYAYDDGTAEEGAYLKKGFGRVAVQFINNKPDAVKAIRINLQTFLDSTRLANTNLSLQIMANDRGKPGRILRGFNGKIIYPNTNNGFVEYAIDPVAVTDTFYVGYTQLSDDEALVVGLDNNTPQFANKHFYNVANSWINVANVAANTGFVPIKGSLMIRPVMGGVAKEITLATEEEIQDRNLVIYPNPTSDIIRWNDASLKNAEIIEMSGRSVLLQKTDNQEINISNLNSGTYILRLSNDKNTFVRKIVKQ